jgi:hypothetical protein
MRLPLGPLLAIQLMLTGPAMAQSPPRPVDPPAGTTGNPTRDDAAPPEVARPVRPASAADSPAALGGLVASLRPSLGLDRGWPGELFDFLAERDWTMLLLVLFNFLLALFAYRLWRSTVGLVEAAREQSRDLKQSIAATKDAADAARRGAEVAALQARVLIGVERPRFELSSVQLEWADQSVRQALKAPSVDIAFTNHGRTSAFVTEKCIEARMTPTLPADPVYSAVETLPVVDAVDSGKTVGASAHRRVGELNEEQIRQVLAGGNTLWVYGFINFHDFLGMKHKLGFCLRWAPPDREASIGGVFLQDGPAHYSYRTEEWPPSPAEPKPVPVGDGWRPDPAVMMLDRPVRPRRDAEKMRGARPSLLGRS